MIEPQATTTSGDSAHQQRIRLCNEWHARPVAHVQSPLRCSHQVFLRRDNASTSERAFAGVCENYNKPAPSLGSRYHLVQIGTATVKWEAHTEADSVTCLVPGNSQTLFSQTAADIAPAELTRCFGNELLCAVHIEVLKQPRDAVDPEQLRGILGANDLYGGAVADGKASLWSSYHLDKTGYSRLVLIDHDLPETSVGRVLQRVLEVETYRMLTMYALPIARATMSAINRIEDQLQPLTEQLAKGAEQVDHADLLLKLSGMAAEIEHLAAANSYRFAAARAYYQIVEQRVQELREEKMPGQPRYSTFLFKTLQPAMRTCDAANQRIEELAQRISRAINLLNAVVTMLQSRQSHNMLESTNRNTKTQIGLQKAVEGFSLFVITYYALGLLNYVLTAAYASGVPVEPKVVTGWLAPVVLVAVWFSTRWARKKVEH
jgi:uncharacterized membrane-anchored protein